MKKIEKYLENVNKHLFKTTYGTLFKVIPFEKDSVKYFMTLRFTCNKNPIKIDINIYEMDKYHTISSSGKEYVPPYFKRNLFHVYDKMKSIKNFKSMKNKTIKINKLLSSEFDRDKNINKIFQFKVNKSIRDKIYEIME